MPGKLSMSADGPEFKFRRELTGQVSQFRQIGWVGQTGEVYQLGEMEAIKATEMGGFAPLYFEVEV